MADAGCLAGGLLLSSSIRTRVTLLLLVLSSLTACVPMRAPLEDVSTRASGGGFLSVVRADAEEYLESTDPGIGVRHRLTEHSALSLAAQRAGAEDMPTVGLALSVHYAF